MFTLAEAYEAVKGRNEFAIKETPHTVCFDYIVILSDTFDLKDKSRISWIRRNFRGVTFCRKTGRMLSLPLHKFFNINQTAETAFQNYQQKNATIYEKVDGSMIHFYRLSDGGLLASTCRSASTPQAIESLAFAKNNPVLESQILATIDQGLTPIFEWVAPHNQIVVRYSECRLVYLISRNRDTGKYIFEEKYQDKAKKYNFKFSDIYQHLDHQFEGYVCHFDDGEMLKAKTPWYLERHRAVDALMRPMYKLYEVALDGHMDDLISIASESYKHKLTAIYDEVQRDLLALQGEIKQKFDEILEKIPGNYAENYANKDFRKTFVELAQKTDVFPELMQMYQNKIPQSLFHKRLMSEYQKKYTEKFYGS